MLHNKLYWSFVIVLVSIISYYYIVISGFNYFYDDVYAYLSYSESLHNFGYIRDVTTIPSAPPITTQNGIVLIYTFLSYFTNDMLVKMQIVSFFLTINLTISYFLIYKIGLLLEISKNILYVLILGFVFNFYFYAYYISPTNDGFYISLFLLSLYLFLRLSIEKNKLYLFFLLIIVLLMPMFRLQGLVVYIAALLTFLIIQKNYPNSIMIFIYIFLSFLTVKLSINFLIDDTSGLDMLSKNLIFNHWDTLQDSLVELFTNAIPSMFLNFPASQLSSKFFFYFKILFSTFLIFLSIITLIQSFRTKNPMIFMITLIVFGNFAALILFNVIIDRYIYINVVFIILSSLFYIKKTYRIYLVTSILIFSLSSFTARLYYKSYDSLIVLKNIEYVNHTYQSYNLISQLPRQTYVYLKKRSITSPQYIDTNIPILIIGNEKFVNHQIKKILQNKMKIVSKNKLSLVWEKDNAFYNTLEIYVKKVPND